MRKRSREDFDQLMATVNMNEIMAEFRKEQSDCDDEYVLLSK